MGTKLNPGKFDAYDKALPDEPMLTLLARDEDAPDTIRDWVRRRIKSRNLSIEQQDEALACADAMERWRRENRPSGQAGAAVIAEEEG